MSKHNKRGTILWGIVVVVFVLLLFYYVLPVVIKVRSDLKAYETSVAYRNNYKLHTTPLSDNVVEDICSKLDIKETSENCQPGAVVYAPELFDEIKTDFRNLSKQDKTYEFVQDKLGAYLDYCEKPHPNGHYRCNYDLRGDYVYPVWFLFDRDNRYYEIIAHIGGS
jgi:hypothetical protein